MFSHFLRKLFSFGRKLAGTQTVRIGSRKWHVARDAMALFGPAGPDLDRWIDNGLAQVVKTGPHRTVYRVALPGGVVYVKHCKVNGIRAWCREVLRPAKARLEFENLFAIRKRGIAAAAPLAWGAKNSPWPGENYLITKGLVASESFLTYVEGLKSPEERRHLARALGQFIAQLHDGGIAHPDPHPGNVLVERTAARVPRFSLIDMHAISIGGPLSWPESRANLVLFNRWFQLRASRSDRLRFWHAYRRSRTALPVPDDQQFAFECREVERSTMVSNLRFWSSRQSRCLGNNRYFRMVKVGACRGHAVADMRRDRLEPVLRDPDAFFVEGRPRTDDLSIHGASSAAKPALTHSTFSILKDSRTSTVAEITLDSRTLILKRVNVRRWFEPIKNLFRPSAVLRSWINGHALTDRWLPTPRPLAVWHRYRRGLPAEGYLLTEKVADATSLDRLQDLTKLARVLRQMHDRGVSHRDLKASNILLEHGVDPILIDLVGVHLGRPIPFKQRARELARLNVSFLTSSAVTRSVRLRFLCAYLRAGDRSIEWKQWWQAISRATEAKRAKNRASGRPLN